MTNMEDFLNVNKDAVNRGIKSLSKNWIILFVGIAYSIINTLIYGVINTVFRGPLSIIAGLIGAFLSAAMISNYLYLLYNVINNNKITIDDFKQGFTAYIYKVYGVMFVFYMVSLLLRITGLGGIYPLLMVLAVVLLNALPETIYQKHYDSTTSISYSFEFAKDNVVNWYVSNLIIGLLLYLLTSNLLFMFKFTSGNSIFRFINISSIVMQAIGSMIMIYRGHLYSILSNSTKRKREFMSKF